MTTTRSTKAAALAAGAALAMTLAACGSNSDDPQSDPSNASSTTPSTTAAATPEDKAQADAQKAVQRLVDAGNAVGSGAPPSRLKTVAVDPLLSELTRAIKAAPGNQKITGTTHFSQWKNVKTSLTSSKTLTPTVQLQVCVDYRDVTTTVNGKEGAKPGGGSQLFTYYAQNADYPAGTWKIAGSKLEGAGCATNT